MSAYPRKKVRAGSGCELRDLNHSVKPALIEANFHSVSTTLRLVLRRAGLADLRNIERA